MKHLYKLFFAFLLLSHFVQAQINLVPNPSFEDTVGCPSALGEIESATGWYSAGGSPDFFHPCANSYTTNAGVPANWAGSQPPLHESTYVGAIVYWEGVSTMREYIGVQLFQPLIIGTEYFVSAFISKGDTTVGLTNVNCATNKFGFRFSTIKYDNNNLTPAPTDNFTQIHSDSVIYNSTDWTQINGSFIADSAYNYFLLGNFYDDANTFAPGCNGIAYYYIDNVCVSTSSTTCEVISSAPAIQNRSSIKLYPNPATDVLSVGNLLWATAYTIFAGNGQVKQQGQLPETDAQISVAGLAPGLYFLQLPQVGTFKFVVSR